MDMSKKIYVVLVGSAPMASLDALLLSLERFKNILSSDSAKSRFETSVRSIQPSLDAVNSFIEAVYAEKNPALAVTMKGRSLIVEIGLTKEEFLDFIYSNAIERILIRIIAVGSMPAKKLSGQSIREYISFPIKYEKGKFSKLIGV